MPNCSDIADTHCGADPQPAGGIARRVREAGLLGDVLDRDQALELEGVVDDQQALELVLVQERLGLGRAGAFAHGDQLVARSHDLADRHVVARLEAQVAPGHDAHHLAAIQDREAGDPQLLLHRDHLPHGVLRRDDDRVAQNAGLVALDAGDLGGLLACAHVLVHDADPALLRDGDGQTRFGHGVHRRGHERKVQRDIAGKPGGEGGVLGQDLGERGHQQHVVEGERFAKKAHG